MSVGAVGGPNNSQAAKKTEIRREVPKQEGDLSFEVRIEIERPDGTKVTAKTGKLVR